MQPSLSELQAKVYGVLQIHGPLSPSQIGSHLDFDYETASPRVTRPIRFLVSNGYVRRIETNKRVVKYEIVPGVLANFSVKPNSRLIKGIPRANF